MMTALNPERDIFISLPGGQHINMLHFLRIFAEAVGKAQKKLDRRQLFFARTLLNETPPGFLRQLFGELTFRRYQITELSIEFAVLQRKTKSTSNAPMRFRLANENMKRERVPHAILKVLVDKQVLAEFRVEGEIIASTVISD